MTLWTRRVVERSRGKCNQLEIDRALDIRAKASRNLECKVSTTPYLLAGRTAQLPPLVHRVTSRGAIPQNITRPHQTNHRSKQAGRVTLPPLPKPKCLHRKCLAKRLTAKDAARFLQQAVAEKRHRSVLLQADYETRDTTKMGKLEAFTRAAIALGLGSYTRPTRKPPINKSVYFALRELFAALDENGNGSLEINELHRLAKLSGIPVDYAAFERIDRSGVITFEEIIRCLYPQCLDDDLSFMFHHWGLPSDELLHGRKVSATNNDDYESWRYEFDVGEATEIAAIYDHFLQGTGSEVVTLDILKAKLRDSVLSDDCLRSIFGEAKGSDPISLPDFARVMRHAYHSDPDRA